MALPISPLFNETDWLTPFLMQRHSARVALLHKSTTRLLVAALQSNAATPSSGSDSSPEDKVR